MLGVPSAPMSPPAVFSHEAMATTFRIAVAHPAADYARQAAAAAFRELDRLESELSRYRESSDLARCNRLADGASTVLGDDALQCLLGAIRLSAATRRAFDPAYASHRPPGAPAEAPLFALDPASHTLTSLCPRLHLDLGAVGKGYALDRMADVLRDWDLPSACLQSGGSTALALAPPPGAPGWIVAVADREFPLAHRAIGASGLSVQGAHLFDPRTGAPADRTTRAWALAADAADADALSTAFFVMTDDERAAYCAAHPAATALWLASDGQLHHRGAPA